MISNACTLRRRPAVHFPNFSPTKMTVVVYLICGLCEDAGFVRSCSCPFKNLRSQICFWHRCGKISRSLFGPRHYRRTLRPSQRIGAGCPRRVVWLNVFAGLF